MTRPDDEIERIKREVDLVALIQESGVELWPVGHEHVGRCPWHSPDTNPSLSANRDKGAWRCFACRIGGSCFDWVGPEPPPARSTMLPPPTLPAHAPAAEARA